MRSVNISIYTGDRLEFEREYRAWEKDLPGTLGHISCTPAMNGPTSDNRCNYMDVPEGFLKVLVTKGIPFVDLAQS